MGKSGKIQGDAAVIFDAGTLYASGIDEGAHHWIFKGTIMCHHTGGSAIGDHSIVDSAVKEEGLAEASLILGGEDEETSRRDQDRRECLFFVSCCRTSS
jgi:hypothetical protein